MPVRIIKHVWSIFRVFVSRFIFKIMDGLYTVFDRYAQQYAAMAIFPYLLCPRITLLMLKLRLDSGVSFAHEHPLCSWVTAIIACFAGTIITNFLLGDSLVPILAEVEQIVTISIIWYLVFFCPFDLFTKIFMQKPIWVVLLVLMEMYRSRNILIGVNMGLSKHPDSWLIIVALGTCKGCGSRILRPLTMFIQGKVDMANEALYPTFVSKLSIIGSVLFIMVHKRFITLSLVEVLVCVAAVGSGLQVLMYLSDARDPFTHLEKGVAAVLFREPSDKADTADNKKKKD